MEIAKLYNLFLQHPTITTDSRNCEKDSIFFALCGDTFNGNKFAQAALDKGCAYAVVDQQAYYKAEDDRYILVNNSLDTLKLLANYHRRQLQTPIIGITGTNGKTTTKELVAAVLSEKMNVWYTQGNFNNEIGVPKTLLCLKPEHQIAVIEMGASHPGDIQSLVNVVEPDYAIITNVGKAHLQGFGSFEGVKQTKAELYDYMEQHKPQGIVFINQDNTHLLEMYQHHCPHVQRITYTTTTNNYIDNVSTIGKVVGNEPYLSFCWKDTNQTTWHKVNTHLIGTYNLDNLLSAVTIGKYFKVDVAQINHALATYQPHNNRSELVKTTHNTLIVDAYNANPTSVEAALRNFNDMRVPRKMVILGDMLELGSVSKVEHQKIADLLRQLRFEKVWLVGSEFANTNTLYRCLKDVEEVKQAFANEHLKNYYILIKGSNGIHLSQLTEVL